MIPEVPSNLCHSVILWFWWDPADHPFAQDMSSYTTISNFAQRRMAPTTSEMEHIVRKSIKAHGQGSRLFVYASRERSQFSAWQKDVDWYCWYFGVLWLQLSHSSEHQHWPENLSIWFSLVFQGGCMCSIPLCVSVCLPISISALCCPSPSPVTFEPVDQFQRNLTDSKMSSRS